MRAARLGAGRAALVTAAARPPSGLERLVDAVSGLFGAPSSVSFRPVDGVLRPEHDPDARSLSRQPPRRVNAARHPAPIRLYDARGRAVITELPPLGLHLDEHA